MFLKNNYFKSEMKESVRTTEASGLKPMTANNFDKYLIEYYSTY